MRPTCTNSSGTDGADPTGGLILDTAGKVTIQHQCGGLAHRQNHRGYRVPAHR
jgi:hypothetical protein